MTLEELIVQFQDRIQDRFFGKYEAVVEDVDDPLGIGRVRVTVPAVLGESVLSGWALPCAPFGGGKDRGMLFLPEVKDTVWVEFAAGDVSRPIWAGAFWGAPESAGGQDDLSKETGAEVPTSEDKPAKAGHLVLRTKSGHRIAFDDEGGLLIIANGAAKAEVRIEKNGEVIIKADKIKLGADASEALIKGDTFKDFFNQHTHPTGVGPSGPPTNPMMPSHLSSKSFTE